MDPKHSVEATGEDVEAAVAAGLEELGVGPSDVLVEVLEEPSRGVFGIGARPALVRLKLLRSPTREALPTAAAPVPVPAEDSEPVVVGDLDEGSVGKEILGELLEKMGVRGSITVKPPETMRSGERSPWILDINGPDMRLLIGRRGETLNSLQYILRLILSRRLQRRANIVVDAGEYKARRSERLSQLAMRMADQAVEQQRTISLEPMPPNERRIIHMTLRNRDDILTKSVGEGNSRKVTIMPKQS